MDRPTFSLAALICAGVAGIGLLTDWRISTGFLLGAFVSVLLYWRTVQFCETMLQRQHSSVAGTVGHFLFSYVLMALPLLISALAPQWFQIFAAAAGLLLIKLVLLLKTLTERRKAHGRTSASDD